MRTRLFQKLVGFAAQRLGNADQTGQRKIVFTAFDAADVCPMHIRALGKRFLRQGHFFSIRAHTLRYSLAILDVHAYQVWKKKAPENIDVTAIAFNTRQPPRTLAKSGLPIPVESLESRAGASYAKLASGIRVSHECHRKTSGRNGQRCGRIISGGMNAPTQLRTQKGSQLPKGNL